jgi:hypothetical protein
MAGKIQPSSWLGTHYLGPDKSPNATFVRLANILNELRLMAVKFNHDPRTFASRCGDNATDTGK